MRVMVTFLGILLAVGLLGWLVKVAWLDNLGCMRPIEEFIDRRTPSGDAARGGAVASGQCGQFVEVGDIEGNWYRDQRSFGWTFDINAEELTEYAVATRAVPGLVPPVAEATVWSVRGLDPENFVVMRSMGGDYFFIVNDGIDEEPEGQAVLCRYATGSELTVSERCGGMVPLPSS